MPNKAGKNATTTMVQTARSGKNKYTKADSRGRQASGATKRQAESRYRKGLGMSGG